MSEPTTVPTTEVLDLLAAIREALTVPHSAGDAGRDREWLLDRRSAAVRAVISSLVDDHRLSEVLGADWWAGHLRDLTAERPVTYPVQESKEEVGA